MKTLMALAVALSTLAVAGVAATSPAEAHFKKKHHHAKFYKAKKCHKYKHVSFRKYKACKMHYRHH
jgi:hypothetical protein